MRSKKAMANVMVSISLQLVTVICGFILPRLILSSYGSEVNGVIASINQFLNYIALLEGGVGNVILASLYKPLADNDYKKLSAVVQASIQFFKKIAFIFIIYLLIVAVIYPLFISGIFSWTYLFTLALILGIKIFSQYYFALSFRLLLQADQKLYITSGIRIAILIINTASIALLILFSQSVHVVYLVSSVVFFIQPIILYFYVKKHYPLDKNVAPDNNSIKQRWDGFGQNIAYFVNSSTDMVVLTIFTNLKEVSVYSIYFMIVEGVKSFIIAISNGLVPTIGNMLAKDEKEKLNETFSLYELVIFIITTILFTSCAILIVPFIAVYTRGIDDVNYLRPMFGYLIVAATAVYCIRDPYVVLAYSAGHFKQTAIGAYTEAIINILLSVVLVIKFGIIGVAIGTLIAMTFRTLYQVYYIKKQIMYRPILIFIKRCLIYGVAVIISIILSSELFNISDYTILNWIIYAIKNSILVSIVTLLLSVIFYSGECKKVSDSLIRVVKRSN